MIKANSDILNNKWKPQEKLIISPAGNKTIVNLDYDDFDKLMDDGYFDKNLDDWVYPKCMNNYKYGFSLENADGIGVYEVHGCKYALLTTCDDEGCFYFVITYWDAVSDSLRFYIPIRGNAIDPSHAHDRVSSYYETKFDNWYLNNGICDCTGDLGDLEEQYNVADLICLNPDASRKEFESIVSLKISNLDQWKKFV